MIRKPAIPLLAVRELRSRGVDPTGGDPHRFARAQHERRQKERRADMRRMATVAFALVAGFCLIGGGVIDRSTGASPPKTAQSSGGFVPGVRADIVDRNGRLLATNLPTKAVYLDETVLVNRAGVAQGLARIFPNLTVADVEAKLDAKGATPRIARRTTPEQQRQVHDLGDPGVLLTRREMRVYPNGHMLAGVLGGWKYHEEAVTGATMRGTGGVELVLDERLSQPETADQPLRLTIDLRVQQVLRDVLQSEMARLNARGAAAVLMDAHSGQVLSLVSLPDYNPNLPIPKQSGVPQGERLQFNRAAQGAYEFGSTFKTFAVAQALENGLVEGPDTVMPIGYEWIVKGSSFKDHRYLGETLPLSEVLSRSSNIGTGRLMEQIESAEQEQFLKKLGLLDTSVIELNTARSVTPLTPTHWNVVERVTISFGYGVTTTLVHMASAYASLVNGGLKVTPTLLADAPVPPRPRVISERTSMMLRQMLEQVVTEGSAKRAGVAGYMIGGKTGSAEKRNPATGQYFDDKVISNMAIAFPIDDPQYVLTILLDEPEDNSGPEPKRTATYTSAPAARMALQRILPILGLRPLPPGQFDAKPQLIYASNGQ